MAENNGQFSVSEAFKIPKKIFKKIQQQVD